MARMDGEIRTAKFNDREHLVLPTIALMEGVVWPYASETRELVLASELEKMDVRSWNGRPVTMDHPMKNGSPSSANEPDVLDKYLIGTVFNAELRDKKLHVESWISVDRAMRVGADAQSVLRRAKNKEEIEVSVGVIIEPEEKHGEYKGLSYDIIWRNIVSDHLAMLPEDTIGACSVEMGCGAPRQARAARVHVFLKDNVSIKEKTMPAPSAQEEAIKTRQRSLRERAAELFGFRAAANEGDLSMNDLWSKLSSILYAEEPAFQGLLDIMPSENSVIYATMPESEFKTFRRKYTVDGDNNVTLNGQRKEVQPVTRYETLEAEPLADVQPPCGCGGKQMSAEKKARVQALITSKKNGFTAASATVLETMTDDQLKALEEADAAAPAQAAGTPATTTHPTPGAPDTGAHPTPGTTTTPTPAPTPSTSDTPTPAPKTLSAAEQEAAWRKDAPPSIVQMLDDKIAQDTAERTATVTALKTKQAVYSETELTAMPLPELRKIAALAGVPRTIDTNVVTDFALRGVPRSASADETVPAPRRLVDALGKKTGTA